MPDIYHGGELLLYGDVGAFGWGDYFTSAEVRKALAHHGGDNPLTVRINSGGGYVREGNGCFNALRDHKGKVTVYVEAMAASAASIIAMAGDEIVIRTGAEMMVHEPWSWGEGNAKAFRDRADKLEKDAAAIAAIYAVRTGKTQEEILALMEAETWMNGKEAVELGFASSAEGNLAEDYAPFNYCLYRNAPEELRNLSKNMNWSVEAQRSPAASVAQQTVKQEIQPMTTQPAAGADSASSTTDHTQANTGDAQTAERERIGKILNCEEAAGRTELAKYLAFETSTSFEEAQKVLAKAAKTEGTEKPEDDVPNTQASTYEQERLRSSNQASNYGSQKTTATATLNRADIFAARKQA
ncbi:head maturation protease, ClpP-related [Pseudovibrio sp. FO-BEG1]|uniref:head maturation protease, ClpP-related n=1 Tax=Pseudovibrio sp. (strain FO-BEG1) TaxID=911045 RepID=UPI0002D3C936|nr:head maturation protease, ClpP-related [Pseudovibrio sp. FO-BEG1]